MSADPKTHPLERFVRGTFGDLFGTVLLAGYGAEVEHREIQLRFSAVAEGEDIQGQVLEISGNLPHGREPLILAALLKLLLSRGSIPTELEFEIPEVLNELGWPETPDTRREVDRGIRKYLGLSYGVRREGAGEEHGLYALVTGYDRDDEIEVEGRVLIRSSLRVHFHRGFVEGLKESKIVFASFDFGGLRWDN